VNSYCPKTPKSPTCDERANTETALILVPQWQPTDSQFVDANPLSSDDFQEIIVEQNRRLPKHHQSFVELAKENISCLKNGKFHGLKLTKAISPVVFGHVDFLKNGEPLIYRDRVFGLDTGCVFGGRLTGLLLPSYTLVSVPSRGNHWVDLRREYLPPRPARPPRTPSPQVLEWDAGAEFALTEIISWTIQESYRLLSQLHGRTGYDVLTSREKANAYEYLIADSPVRSLLHLARHDKLTRDLARRFLKTSDRTLKTARLLKVQP
jgi:hypothetical protein